MRLELICYIDDIETELKIIKDNSSRIYMIDDVWGDKICDDIWDMCHRIQDTLDKMKEYHI